MGIINFTHVCWVGRRVSTEVSMSFIDSDMNEMCGELVRGSVRSRFFTEALFGVYSLLWAFREVVGLEIQISLSGLLERGAACRNKIKCFHKGLWKPRRVKVLPRWKKYNTESEQTASSSLLCQAQNGFILVRIPGNHYWFPKGLRLWEHRERPLVLVVQISIYRESPALDSWDAQSKWFLEPHTSTSNIVQRQGWEHLWGSSQNLSEICRKNFAGNWGLVLGMCGLGYKH